MRKYILEYDKEADAAYIRIQKKSVHDTIEMSKGIYADVDKKGKVIGIELLKFSKRRQNVVQFLLKGIENIMVVR